MAPYNQNIPQPGDIPAQSQALILQNFQYLNNLVEGVNNAILFEQVGVAPTVINTQVGMYNVLTGGNNTLIVKNGIGTAVDILTCGKNVNGWCFLPCGIIMAWGNFLVGATSTQANALTSATIPTFPGFTNVYNAQVTIGHAAGLTSALSVTNLAAATMSVYNPNAVQVTAYFFVIGS